jgi:hypothetical protein
LGASYRLEVAAAIAAYGGSTFTTQGIADDTGIRYPRVQQELKHLLAAEMLVLSESPAPYVNYKAVADPYWEVCVRLLDDWTAE